MATARRRVRRPDMSVVQPPPSRHPPACFARPSPLPPSSTAGAPASRPDCRGRLSIGYQITGDQLQVTIEVACQTDRMQVLTTIGWASRIDDVSRCVLTNALHAAADECCPVRIHAFAAAARDLFKHAAKALAARHKDRARRRCFRHPAAARPSDNVIPEPGPLHDQLLAAIDDLRNTARLRPRITATDRAEAGRCVAEALSALHGLYALLGSYLEHALQPLEPLIGRDAIHAFVLETRAEVDELAACHTAGDVYLESLTVTEAGDKTVSLEVEGALGCGAKRTP